jgi:hypothetical protein
MKRRTFIAGLGGAAAWPGGGKRVAARQYRQRQLARGRPEHVEH